MEQKITIDKLNAFGACKEGIEWFSSNYPNGATIDDILDNRRISTAFLHWGYSHFSTNEPQKQKYWERTEVDENSRPSTYASFKVSNSTFVSNSTRVRDSKYVFGSNDVRNCENILKCKSIKTSSEIYDSNFVSSSMEISRSLNITNCANIVNGTMLVECDNCANITDAMKSRYCNRCEKLRDCYFCENCSNLKNCLFCYDMKDGENLIFNKRVEPEMIAIIRDQIDEIADGWDLCLVDEWPRAQVPLGFPRAQGIFHFYDNAPEAFWDWVVSLPNFDRSVLINITRKLDFD